MRALEKQLAALRAQCQAGHSAAECGILHELVAAAQGEACACPADVVNLPASEQLNTGSAHGFPEIAIQCGHRQRLAHGQFKILGVIARQAELTGC